jgi:hypothetical protein
VSMEREAALFEEMNADAECASCGAKVVTGCGYFCEGHQHCLTECPSCGGILLDIVTGLRFDGLSEEGDV